MLTRRTLVAGAGVLPFAGKGAVARADTAPGVHRGQDRAFLGNEGFRNVPDGFQLKVRLTSYRSLPLSCIRGIRLKVDGEEIDPKALVLKLNYASYKVEDLPRLSAVWWFILDYADLFVPRAAPLAAGEHDVEGTLITVEPYMTAGRFAFYSTSRKRLLLEAD
jgi:hypothetical protein